MLKDKYRGINTLRKTVRIGIIDFYYAKRHVLLGRLFVDKEIMNYTFITTKECYSISIICYRVPTRVL